MSKSKSSLQVPQRLKITITVVAGNILAAETYWYIFHGHRFGIISTSTLWLFATLSIVLLYMLWIDTLWRSNLLKALSTLVYFGLFLLFCGAVDDFHKKRLAQQLAHYGITGYGHVTGFEMEHRKGGSVRYAIYEYQHQGQLYKQRVRTNSSTHYHQLLQLRYASIDPENVIVTRFGVTNATADKPQ
ncbi:hypothetical protein PK28_15770 [Hymenobacter sp. DG25B]|uniref:hypothetical protein n=1 Tax=Hymenobacter sp. DG25B TaxID=1385664 RepID=UPI0005412380|nr:hypothetical protein [Hymenobacter sp. DG25B]AIZ64770.1 hypothetical protein PK28_15770 [Hymenobacter sp. DG25B]